MTDTAQSGRRKSGRRLMVGLAFLAPNILGFAAFTLLPLVLSFALAFTDWDIKQHNIFTDNEIRFVGFANFVELFSHREFWKYFGNTLFLMMGIPFSIAGSLIAALMLTRNLKTGGLEKKAFGIAAAGLVVSLLLLAVVGFSVSGLFALIGMLLVAALFGGLFLGTNVYRTIYYLPHFTAGVATFLLWKQMYNPQTGPINTALTPLLGVVEAVFSRTGGWFGIALGTGFLLLSVFTAKRFLDRSVRTYLDADAGWLSLVASVCGMGFSIIWPSLYFETILLRAIGCILTAVLVIHTLWRWLREEPFRRVSAVKGLDRIIFPAVGTAVLAAALVAFGLVFETLPVAAGEGLAPPHWLADYGWAKPALMIMAFWMAVGSNNMILYIAGLTNIPKELYEAADVDGASPYQRFWNVTWPQLAPVTFFIFIMSVIQGLQGGFEMARAMTQGGPAGATTTLSYFVFIEGFETGRLGYASAVVWTLFLMVFTVTVINFKFGNRYVND